MLVAGQRDLGRAVAAGSDREHGACDGNFGLTRGAPGAAGHGARGFLETSRAPLDGIRLDVFGELDGSILVDVEDGEALEEGVGELDRDSGGPGGGPPPASASGATRAEIAMAARARATAGKAAPGSGRRGATVDMLE
jgi:hypothetical protein